MNRLWNYCAFCGKRIETGEKCYGLPNGESVCKIAVLQKTMVQRYLPAMNRRADNG